MSEEYLVHYCSPTLAGLKTGNLFSCPCSDRADVNDAIRVLNGRLSEKGLRLLLLRCLDGRALLYLYRPARLKHDLEMPEAQALLHSVGYADLRYNQCLGELIRRLRHVNGFPHEIGLFLSYPPEDVRGFIEHKGKDCKFVGCWKVYGDANKAQNLFVRYKKCTTSYLRQRSKGVSLDRLAVAERSIRKDGLLT